ncbi:uncharacterized protein LOC122076524 isoform X2 [Macadamia integrifolia]|uniref:uncharacterized protein LOC122076524 isoform X2 n=1 Tax=Macadamia integrifolia TaxID=60698 RepID=UPI001C4E5426|nr:uncharacterized protein LOC122076524 isoform X2 [Macadamia integrifolia]
MPGSPEDVGGTPDKEIPRAEEGSGGSPSAGLRRRFLPPIKSQDRTHEISESDQSTPIKLDAAAQAHIEKHRKLQEDLTDEMVGLARQLKESSLLMNRSLQDTEKFGWPWCGYPCLIHLTSFLLLQRAWASWVLGSHGRVESFSRVSSRD